MALLLKNAHVCDPQTGLNKVVDLVIRDGVIADIGQNLTIPKGVEIDCKEKMVIPGLVDMHGHLREPGFEYKETIASGARSAAVGGYTDICCMPNTLPVADNSSVIEFIVKRAAEQGYCRVHPFGAITQGLEGKKLAELYDMKKAGARAFSDDGHGVQSPKMMRAALDYAKMFDVLLVAHSEDENLAGKGCVHEGIASTKLGLPGQPGESESIMVARDMQLAQLTGGRVHIAHLSSRHSVEALREAKKKGLSVSGEVTPHHLFLSELDLDDTYNTNLKVNPPLRSVEDQQALIEALIDGTIDVIATDSAPHAPQEKDVEFEAAAFGTIGYETALPLVFTKLVKTKKMPLERMVEVMAINPRSLLGLEAVKIEVGSSADLTIFDPKQKREFVPSGFASCAQNSAFIGEKLYGVVTDVIVSGYHTLQDGKVIAS